MTGILAIGRHAGPFLPQPTHVVHVDADRVVADTAALHAVITEQLALQGPVLVIHPADLEPEMGRRLRLVRAALDHPSLLWHATTLPPLAADVLVTLAAALAGPLGGPACVAEVIPLLERQIVHWTWVPSVAKVEHPAPTLWQHAQSSLPGSSWLVTSWPHPAIERLRAEPPAVPRPGQDVAVAVAVAEDGETGWVQPMLAAQLPGIRPLTVDAPGDLAAWYGCRQATQVVMYPTSVAAMADLLRARLDPGTCRWCRREVGGMICPWCALPRSGVTRIEEQAGADLPPIDSPRDRTSSAPGNPLGDVARGASPLQEVIRP